MTPTRGPFPYLALRFCTLVFAALCLSGCGGGGGGGGSSDGPDQPPLDKVEFTGFTFRVGDNPPTGVPPIENVSAIPPTLGAPLDLTVIFNFTGVAQGPFTQANLPVFTTSAEVTPAAFPELGQFVIPAKGTYLPVGNTVEFRPFVPTEPLQVTLSASPASVPGLLPGSTYTAQVIGTNGEKIINLHGPGGIVKFSTTSNPAGYYATGAGDGNPPELLAALPPDGTTGFFPGVFSNFAPGAALPTFPEGPASVTLNYDHPLLPTSLNLDGTDWDADGVVDRTFFFRARATRLLVGLQVPASSSIGNVEPFPAISGLTEGLAVSPDGAEIFLHDSEGSGSLAGADPHLSGVPSSIAVGRDPSLLWVILKVDGGNDLLTVVDQVLGDPKFANISADAALDTGLDDVVGLTTLQSGRLIAFDRTSHQLVELVADVVRHLPAGAPELASPNGDGTVGHGFVSAAFPGNLDVLDLAQMPSGTLLALVENGSSFPAIIHLAAIDPDLNGEFAPADGTWDTSMPLIPLDAAYAAIEGLAEDEVLALNRSADTIDILNLTAGTAATAVNGVGAYGVPLASLPGGVSPAQSLAIGFMDQDADVTLTTNAASGAVVTLTPQGILPIGAEVDVMQRFALASLNGVSPANADPDMPLSVLGAIRLLSVTTSSPTNTVGACTVADPEGRVNDVYQEEFVDTKYEDPNPPSLTPKAEWAEFINGLNASGHLRASVGASDETTLGDFLPVPFADFDLTKAYTQLANPQDPHFKFVFFDTDVQNFPLADGSTPGVTTNTKVQGGKFAFRDFIIPQGVYVIARGSRPLQITATGKVEIHGVLDVQGSNGTADISFDSGFTPVPGGTGGPGAGRGGNGHPTIFDPKGAGTVDQYATPETGERGFGPVIDASGVVTVKQVGGHGGVSTLGADFLPSTYPKFEDLGNTEFSRPPGGGGGTFYFHGMYAHEGTGAYLVQSSSSFGSFTHCEGVSDWINQALYGNEENKFQGLKPNTPVQCVYLVGTPQNPNRFFAGGKEGDLVFKDGDPSNDFFGPGGELTTLIGGQGGGGGGTRIDSFGHQKNGVLIWAGNDTGGPQALPPFAPPYYPLLALGGVGFFSPTLFDAKGGGGGGGGGSVLIRTFGDVLISRTGHIIASGGAGQGGEPISNSNYAGGGGGGSGGAVVLQAAGSIRVTADANHVTPFFTDIGGTLGGSIDVSGGNGKDAITNPNDADTQPKLPEQKFTRGDGGQGGFGLIQLQAGGTTGKPVIDQGAYLFARVHNVLKQGTWTGDPGQSGTESVSFAGGGMGGKPPDIFRYIDIFEYRSFLPDPLTSPQFYSLLNGAADPLVVPSVSTPPKSFQLDTPMITHFGKLLVKEPNPEKIMKTYAGWDPVTFIEHFAGPGLPPGTVYDANDLIPMSIYLKEPDGTPFFQETPEGVPTQEFDRYQTIDRLPVVPLDKTPTTLSTVSRGTSLWLDFNGVALRVRNSMGLAPPLFTDGFNGTFNPKQGVVPPGKDGQVITGSVVLGKPAHFVAKAGSIADPGLCVTGPGPYPPFNDIKVDAPEVPQLGLENAISDNATVVVLFQGAFPVRSGSHVPDATTLTSWVSDLRELSGYPLIRFQVTFNLAANPAVYPFGADSFRPAVDRVRVRARY